MTTDHLAAEARAAAKAILRRFAAGRSYAARDFENGIWNATIEVPVAIDAMIEALARLDRMTEALNGYRAAISYVGADSWDGCDDCIEILKAASAADSDKPRLTADQAAVALSRLRALGGQVGEG